jgi:hypothetical protein
MGSADESRRVSTERVGFEPTVPDGYTRFRGVRLRPLGHLSNRNEDGYHVGHCVASDVAGFRPYMARPTDPRTVVNSGNELSDLAARPPRDDFDLVEISSLHFWRYERHRHRAFHPAFLVKAFETDFLNCEFYRHLAPMFAGTSCRRQSSSMRGTGRSPYRSRPRPKPAGKRSY